MSVYITEIDAEEYVAQTVTAAGLVEQSIEIAEYIAATNTAVEYVGQSLTVEDS